MMSYNSTLMDFVEEETVCQSWQWNFRIAVICYKYVKSIIVKDFDILLFQDAKVVTIFNMIAVPCFVYQGAVGLIGDLITEMLYK